MAKRNESKPADQTEPEDVQDEGEAGDDGETDGDEADGDEPAAPAASGKPAGARSRARPAADGDGDDDPVESAVKLPCMYFDGKAKVGVKATVVERSKVDENVATIEVKGKRHESIVRWNGVGRAPKHAYWTKL